MKSNYQKIKGLGSGRGKLHVAVRMRLYEGPDHLLLVQSTGYSEEYKRVFYRDIRYVVAQKSNGQGRQALTSALFFFAACLLFLTDMPKVGVVLIASPFLVWFLLNLALGPACRVYINTEVQTIELPTPRRLGRLPRLITFLNTKILPGRPEVEQVVA